MNTYAPPTGSLPPHPGSLGKDINGEEGRSNGHSRENASTCGDVRERGEGRGASESFHGVDGTGENLEERLGCE